MQRHNNSQLTGLLMSSSFASFVCLAQSLMSDLRGPRRDGLELLGPDESQ